MCDDATDFVKRIVIESPEAIAQRQRIPPHRLAHTAALHRWYRIAHGKLSRIEKCIEWLKMSTHRSQVWKRVPLICYDCIIATNRGTQNGTQNRRT